MPSLGPSFSLSPPPCLLPQVGSGLVHCLPALLWNCSVIPLSNATHSSLFSPQLLVADVSVWGTFLLAVSFRHVICGFYLFFLPVRLSSKIQKLPPNLPVKGFPGVWKLPVLRPPSWEGSPFLALLSLFLSFILCPTSFQRQWAACLGAWCPLLVIRSCIVQFA